jgi:hypothetical protein
VFPTTYSSSAWTVEVATQYTQNGSVSQQALLVNSTGMASGSINSVQNSPNTVWLSAGATIAIGTFTVSGSNTGGVFSYAVTIERLQ